MKDKFYTGLALVSLFCMMSESDGLFTWLLWEIAWLCVLVFATSHIETEER